MTSALVLQPAVEEIAHSIRAQDATLDGEPVRQTDGTLKHRPFHSCFGSIPWTDADRIRKSIAEDIPTRVAAALNPP